METRQTNIASNHRVTSREATPEEDMQNGIDILVGPEGHKIPFAWRARDISWEKWGDISIRYKTKWGKPTEYHKILNGSYIPQWYVCQFVDATVICRVEDVKKCLVSGKYKVINNSDGTAGAYIHNSNIEHLVVSNSYLTLQRKGV